MEEVDDSWRCRRCYKIASWNHIHCPWCGGHWNRVQDNTYVPQKRRPRSRNPRQVHHQQDQEDWDQNWEEGGAPRSSRSGSNKGKQRPRRRRQQNRIKSRESTVPTYSTPALPPPWKPDKTLPKDAKESAAIAAAQDNNAELAHALREAYPDPKEMPDYARKALEKAEVRTTQQINADMLKSTTSLGDSRSLLQKLNEAKTKHRNSWLKHLKLVMESLEKQMNAFDAQQEEYASRINDTQKRITILRRDVQRLNQHAAHASIPEIPLAEDHNVDTAELDSEEITLRSQVGDLLQKCLKASGRGEAIEIKSEEEDDEAMAPSSKRQRSIDPPHGSKSGSGAM
eukprot:s2370_g2.t1